MRGQEIVNECTVQGWFQRFRLAQIDLNGKEGRGRPSAIDDSELKALANTRKLFENLQKTLTYISQLFRRLR